MLVSRGCRSPAGVWEHSRRTTASGASKLSWFPASPLPEPFSLSFLRFFFSFSFFTDADPLSLLSVLGKTKVFISKSVLGFWLQYPFLDSPQRKKVSPGGFLRMNVQSLCLVSSMPRYPQALQEVPIVCFLGLTCCKDKKINYFVPKKLPHNLVLLFITFLILNLKWEVSLFSNLIFYLLTTWFS